MSLREVLIDELRDLYSAENQLIKALPKTAKGSESAALKEIFTTHLEETKGHVERLKQVFEMLGKKATGKHCSGMEGAIEEVKEALEEDEEGALLDAGIVGAAARVEHYEIAGYSAAILIAATLGETEIVGLLKETLAEEQNAGKLVMNAAKVILKQAYAEEGDDKDVPEKKPKDVPEKKPKDAKEKKSEADSKKDEREAAKSLGKSAKEVVDAVPAKKSARKN
jgi:ferritin-like metal-binding protein YciE